MIPYTLKIIYKTLIQGKYLKDNKFKLSVLAPEPDYEEYKSFL